MVYHSVELWKNLHGFLVCNSSVKKVKILACSQYPCYVPLKFLFCFSGMTYTTAQKWFELADIQFFAKATYYTYQASLVLPAVERMFLKSLEESVQDVIARGMYG